MLAYSTTTPSAFTSPTVSALLSLYAPVSASASPGSHSPCYSEHSNDVCADSRVDEQPNDGDYNDRTIEFVPALDEVHGGGERKQFQHRFARKHGDEEEVAVREEPSPTTENNHTPQV